MRTTRTEIVCDRCGRTATVEGEYGPASNVFENMGWGLIATADRDLCPPCYRDDKARALAEVRDSLRGLVNELEETTKTLHASHYCRDLLWVEKVEDTDVVIDALDSIAFATTICARVRAVLAKRIDSLESDDGSSAPTIPYEPEMCLMAMGKRYVKAYEVLANRMPEYDEEEDE